MATAGSQCASTAISAAAAVLAEGLFYAGVAALWLLIVQWDLLDRLLGGPGMEDSNHLLLMLLMLPLLVLLLLLQQKRTWSGACSAGFRPWRCSRRLCASADRTILCDRRREAGVDGGHGAVHHVSVVGRRHQTSTMVGGQGGASTKRLKSPMAAVAPQI